MRRVIVIAGGSEISVERTPLASSQRWGRSRRYRLRQHRRVYRLNEHVISRQAFRAILAAHRIVEAGAVTQP